ncbi:hypothetical protein CVT26_002436 [Gymnopilus dilepis]|uniref:Uncharacterized protein n=1 Tax=Gymnopilus dilepis TaxID=231916 RepID=A0A409Y3T6_9AGAR|nr:hypothetical protein CVT26_002436 [Gymnopilus dilepis]
MAEMDTHSADQAEIPSSPLKAPVKKKVGPPLMKHQCLAQRAMAEMDTHSADQAEIPSSPLKAPVKKKASGKHRKALELLGAPGSVLEDEGIKVVRVLSSNPPKK